MSLPPHPNRKGKPACLPITLTMYPRKLALICLLLLLAACAPPPSPDSFPAPDFTLLSLHGESVTLSEQRGSWVILNFWATWCAPCIAEMPVLQTLAHQRAATHTLYGINVRESPDLVAAFAQDHAITFPLLLNPPDSVLLDYNVIGLPQTLVINPSGEVVWRQFGPLDLAAFGAVLDSLLA